MRPSDEERLREALAEGRALRLLRRERGERRHRLLAAARRQGEQREAVAGGDVARRAREGLLEALPVLLKLLLLVIVNLTATAVPPLVAKVGRVGMKDDVLFLHQVAALRLEYRIILQDVLQGDASLHEDLHVEVALDDHPAEVTLLQTLFENVLLYSVHRY